MGTIIDQEFLFSYSGETEKEKVLLYKDQNLIENLDWDYYGISQTLNLDEISNYYIQKIKSIKPKLIFINESKLHLGK